LKVGGPAAGYSGSFQAGNFIPSEFVTNFLALCRRESVPLDFFSWHCYTADPTELVARARAVRKLLDAYGFTATESHLNEWNFLPGNTWEPFGQAAAPEVRQGFYEQMGGAAGAAFVTTALIELQDAPVDVCNFYHGELGGFGLFNEYGVPNRVFYALRAFSKLARLPQRARAAGARPGKVAILAAKDPRTGRAAVLISNFDSSELELELEVSGLAERATYEIRAVNAKDSWSEPKRGPVTASSGVIRLQLTSPGVALIELQPE
jgi:xylan 1,4-beta-xylosidase